MSIRLTEPGVYQLAAEDYFADPAPEPSLSHSILKMLIPGHRPGRSPRHVRLVHPRLRPGPAHLEKPTEAKEHGAVLHKLLLGTGVNVVEIASDDWKKHADQQRRAEARAAGRIPILSRRLAELHECADAVIEQMLEIEACAEFFDPDCMSEATLLWQLGPLWCRALVDRMAPTVWFDLKSTGISAAPEDYNWTIEREHATQDSWYRSGARALAEIGKLAVPPTAFRFVVFETYAPYCIATYEVGQSLAESATADIRAASATWARCLLTDTWPGYGREVRTVEASVSRMIRSQESELQWNQEGTIAV